MMTYIWVVYAAGLSIILELFLTGSVFVPVSRLLMVKMQLVLGQTHTSWGSRIPSPAVRKSMPVGENTGGDRKYWPLWCCFYRWWCGGDVVVMCWCGAGLVLV